MIYRVLALQTACRAINRCADHSEAKSKILENIHIIRKQIIASKQFIGQALKLVVLPEYFATGFPMHENFETWRDKACTDFNDEIFENVASIAAAASVYLSGNLYDKDPNFPDFYFQSSFIIDPEGKLVLKYRRLNSMFAITPYDVLDEYISRYGKESLFPVVKTEIGNLACIASEEILYPEIARCLMMRGAEIFCHNTSEVCSPQHTQKGIAKRARAIENMAYVISANSAQIVDTDFPAASTDGNSIILDYEGRVLAEAGQGETMVANATIDLSALRHHRSQPGMSNFISRQRNALFADSYANYTHYPPNLWKPGFVKADFTALQRKVIELLFDKS